MAIEPYDGYYGGRSSAKCSQTKEATMSFQDELRSLINRYSRENKSNTPDFILVEYIMDSLNAFDKATNEREGWHGLKRKSGSSHPPGFVELDFKKRLEALEEHVYLLEIAVSDPTARSQRT